MPPPGSKTTHCGISVPDVPLPPPPKVSYNGACKPYTETVYLDAMDQETTRDLGRPRLVRREWLTHWRYRISWSEMPEIWNPTRKASGARYIALYRRGLASSRTWRFASPDLAVSHALKYPPQGPEAEAGTLRMLAFYGLTSVEQWPPAGHPAAYYPPPAPEWLPSGPERATQPDPVVRDRGRAKKYTWDDVQVVIAKGDKPRREEPQEPKPKGPYGGFQTMAEYEAWRDEDFGPLPPQPGGGVFTELLEARRATETAKEEYTVFVPMTTEPDAGDPYTEPVKEETTEQTSDKVIENVPGWLKSLSRRV